MVSLASLAKPQMLSSVGRVFARILSECLPLLRVPERPPRCLGGENIGYVDLLCNCRLCFDQVYIRIEGRPANCPTTDLRSLYSPKAERVLRALLLEPKQGWKIKELAATAGVSLGQASNVKKLLEDREWLQRSDRGICLIEPSKLLEEWSQNYSYRENKAWDFY